MSLLPFLSPAVITVVAVVPLVVMARRASAEARAMGRAVGGVASELGPVLVELRRDLVAARSSMGALRRR